MWHFSCRGKLMVGSGSRGHVEMDFRGQYSAATMSARALATVGTSFPALVLGSRILKMKKP